jgi:hypothetical protein
MRTGTYDWDSKTLPHHKALPETRHTVAVHVLDANEMKASLLGIERLNGRDEPPPVADGGEHAGAWVLNGRGRCH